MALGFNFESYLEHSKKVDVEDFDFSQVARYPLTKDEVRCLTYMMDIEGHTIVYLKNILSTCAVRDSETTAFLSCWAYEEFFHSRVLAQFLRACWRRPVSHSLYGFAKRGQSARMDRKHGGIFYLSFLAALSCRVSRVGRDFGAYDS